MAEGTGAVTDPRRYKVGVDTAADTVDMARVRRDLIDQGLIQDAELEDGDVVIRFLAMPEFDGPVDPDQIVPILAEPPDPAVVAQVDAYMAGHGPLLSVIKYEAAQVIDATAEFRITQSDGFEYPPDSGMRFSMSVVAQVKWLGFYAARDSVPYPITAPTKDDQGSISLANAEAVAGLYLTMVGTMKAILDGATAAKAAIVAATDEAGVTAAVEAYVNG